MKKFIQSEVHVRVDAIYKVAKLKEDVSDVDFARQIETVSKAVKNNLPENIFIDYTEIVDGEKVPFSMNLKEIGEKELCKTIRAVAAIGGCIQQGRNDCDRPAIIKLYCLGHHIPSGLVADRGNIISKDKINCESVPLMKAELLK